MPDAREYGCLELCVTAKNLFGLRQKDATQDISKLMPEQNAAREDGAVREEVAKEGEKLKLPDLTSSKCKNEVSVNRGVKNDLQVLLKGFQCFVVQSNDGLKQLRNVSEKSFVYSHSPWSVKPSDCGDASREESSGILENKKGNDPPLAFSIIEGQRVSLKEKDGGRRQHSREKLSNQNNRHLKGKLTSGSSDFESLIDKHIGHGKILPGRISLKAGRQDCRQVFRLPKAEKYDITPRNIMNSKVCSVFKLGQPQPSRIYSVYRDNYTPGQNSYCLKHSVYKSIAKKPPALTRQPSPVAGVPMTVKDQDDNVTTAIQAVEECNKRPPLVTSVVAEVPRQVKKCVIKLPPIC